MNAIALSAQPSVQTHLTFIVILFFIFLPIGEIISISIFYITKYFLKYDTIDRIKQTIDNNYTSRFGTDLLFVSNCHLWLAVFVAVTTYILPNETTIVLLSLVVAPIIYSLLLFVSIIAVLPRVGFKWYDVVPTKQEYKEVAFWSAGTTAINIVLVIISFLLLSLVLPY